MRTDILDRKEDILRWIDEKRPKGYICQQLVCKPETLNSYLKKMGIEYAGQPGRGVPLKKTGYLTAEEYIHSGSVVKSHILKGKLIRDGIKKKECEICGVSMWQGVELPLELHHKDRNHYNNEINNLAILCPNCHSIQEGNSGANAGKYLKERTIINETTLEEEKVIVIEEKIPEPAYFCCDCGIPISRTAKRCKSCASKERQKGISNKPDRECLKQLIRTTSFLQIGKMFNVSDNAVRKWCDGYNLPRKSTEIKAYSQEEWDKI